jgi:hypothetical protein
MIDVSIYPSAVRHSRVVRDELQDCQVIRLKSDDAQFILFIANDTLAAVRDLARELNAAIEAVEALEAAKKAA